jgi:hypothetical protein
MKANIVPFKRSLHFNTYGFCQLMINFVHHFSWLATFATDGCTISVPKWIEHFLSASAQEKNSSPARAA